MLYDPPNRLKEARDLDRAGKSVEALEAFRDFLDGQPDSTEGWVDYAGLLMVLGQLDEAQRACDRALQIDPGHYGALVHSACVQMHQGNLAASQKQFLEAIAMDPDRIAGRLMFSDCLVRKGALDEARALLTKVLDQEPGLVLALDRLNTVMACQGDWAGLRKDMARQLTSFPGAEAEYVAGQLDLLFGDMPQGWTRFEARLKIHSSARPCCSPGSRVLATP